MGRDAGDNVAGARDRERETIARKGWHPDPFDLAAERWWNGTTWTKHVRGEPLDGPEAPAQSDVAATERLRGRPPGWYPWRDQVARWWDGEQWGSARRPFADHFKPHESARPKPRRMPRWGYVSVVALVVTGVVLGITLSVGSSPPSYRARVGRLCRQAFARERADILLGSTPAISAPQSRSQAVLVARLLGALLRDSAGFDKEFKAITPPSSLRSTQEQYLTLERQDSAIYALVIPRLEGRSGLQALDTVSPLLGRNAVGVQRLLEELGGVPCSLSPLG